MANEPSESSDHQKTEAAALLRERAQSTMQFALWLSVGLLIASHMEINHAWVHLAIVGAVVIDGCIVALMAILTTPHVVDDHDAMRASARFFIQQGIMYMLFCIAVVWIIVQS